MTPKLSPAMMSYRERLLKQLDEPDETEAVLRDCPDILDRVERFRRGKAKMMSHDEIFEGLDVDS